MTQPEAKQFVSNTYVEIQREPGATWEQAVYVARIEGQHRVKVYGATPRYVQIAFDAVYVDVPGTRIRRPRAT